MSGFGFRLPAGFTVTIRRPVRDGFGDVLSVTEHPVHGCGLLRHATSEDRDGREQVTETATLTLPPGADVRSTDDVVFPDGSVWHADGRQYLPLSPLTGWEPGIVVPLRRVTG